MPYAAFGLGADIEDEYRFLIDKYDTKAGLYQTWDACINSVFQIVREDFIAPDGNKGYCPKTIEDLKDIDFRTHKRFKWSITAEAWDTRPVRSFWYATNGGWSFQLYYIIFELTPKISTSSYIHPLRANFK